MIDLLTKLKSDQLIHSSEIESFFDLVFQGEINDTDIQQVLSALHYKGETVDDVIGVVSAMKKVARRLDLGRDIIDVCGTGGSGKNRFNISTVVSFVLGSMGVNVAKHGNVGSKKPNGSFDFLTELGINYNLSSADTKMIFSDQSLCFLFARLYHPNMKYVAPIRKRLDHRTIFNIVGPLCSPVDLDYQLIGTINESVATLLAASLSKLNRKRAIVVFNDEGIDEFSINSTNTYYIIENNTIKKASYKYLGVQKVKRLPLKVQNKVYLFLKILSLIWI